MPSMAIERRLLSVDDDPAILRLIARIATDLDFSVESIAQGELFRDAYQRFTPTVVTLDIFMPGVDGIELLLWLAQIKSSAHVIVTSGAELRYLPMANEIGRQHGSLKLSQLSKPFDIVTLRSTLLADL
jgi:DNA-binding response OmpR family regulator